MQEISESCFFGIQKYLNRRIVAGVYFFCAVSMHRKSIKL
ncbi:MAG: hypothetical protein ACI9IV_000495 [Paracoccaceae bacterium]|jgi:hypothetical protein